MTKGENKTRTSEKLETSDTYSTAQFQPEKQNSQQRSTSSAHITWHYIWLLTKQGQEKAHCEEMKHASEWDRYTTEFGHTDREFKIIMTTVLKALMKS
jgi:hypothetical protein